MKTEETKPLHEYSDGKFTCLQYPDGKFTVNGTEQPWYKNSDGTALIVKRAKSFKGLCKMAIKDGDFD